MPVTNRKDALLQARAALAAGQAATAAGICERLLLRDGGDVEARHLHGRCLGAVGQVQEACAEFRAVLSAQPDHYQALVDLGVASASAGAHAEARALLERAIRIDARPAQVHLGLGLCLLGAGDAARAEAAFREALARNPRIPDAYNNLGVACERQGRLAEALDCFRQACTLQPGFFTAQLNAGDAALRLGRADVALAAFTKAVELGPADAAAHAGLGAVLLSGGDFAAAARELRAALGLDPGLGAAAGNLGEALRNLGMIDEASGVLHKALDLSPALGEAHIALARIAEARGEPDVAVAQLRRGAQAAPSSPGLPEALGDLLQRLRQPAAALPCYQQALALDPARPAAWLSLGRCQEILGLHTDAIVSIERSLQLAPRDPAAFALRASCAFRTCDWNRAEDSIAQLRAIPSGLDQLNPFLLLAADLLPEETAGALRRRGAARPAAGMLATRRRYAHPQLRIAYLSPDFRDHPVAHALAGVIDCHDRRRFSPCGVALTPPTPGGIGGRLRGAFDEFLDAAAMSDAEVAEWLRAREIDIAVDLAGYTVGARPGIFSLQPATAQVNYLGFPGSSGVSTMDFIIADAVVLPRGDEALFSERVLRMPHSYLPFDNSRHSGDPSVDRAAAGLPEGAFVFCGFTNAYKLSRSMFELWLDLLLAVPGSLLWLRTMVDPAREQLLARTRERGIDTGRLVFAPYVEDMNVHLGRLRLADIFLDTRPYNAHTTAAEALWAGVPVITCPGNRFAGRVGASVLAAAGLTDLVCADLDAYRRMALDLAADRARLAEVRHRIGATRSSVPLFDTQRYTADLETLLLTAWSEASL